MKLIEAVRKYDGEQGIAEDEAIERGMDAESIELAKKGLDV